jgi:hypothetical protein
MYNFSISPRYLKKYKIMTKLPEDYISVFGGYHRCPYNLRPYDMHDYFNHHHLFFMCLQERYNFANNEIGASQQDYDQAPRGAHFEGWTVAMHNF